jgi:transcriptional antiterminator NusG
MYSSPEGLTKMAQNGQKWYLIHTYTGHEKRVKTNLERRIKSMVAEEKISQIVIPTVDEVEIKGGKRHNVSKKLFPGYILVRMELDDQSWNTVRNTPGVTGFISAQDKHGKLVPVPLKNGEAEEILRKAAEGAPRVKVGFSKGESIRVIDGPFIDFIGVVNEINSEKGKVKVLVSFFGRETPIELDFLQVERL